MIRTLHQQPDLRSTVKSIPEIDPEDLPDIETRPNNMTNKSIDFEITPDELPDIDFRREYISKPSINSKSTSDEPCDLPSKPNSIIHTGKVVNKRKTNKDKIGDKVGENEKLVNKKFSKVRPKDTEHFKEMKRRAIREQHLYEIEEAETNNSFTIRKKDNTIHIVTFSDCVVTCTCRAMIELQKKSKIATKHNNEVCKHIALIIGKTKDGCSGSYTGKQFYSPDEFKKTKSILKTFNPNKVIPDTFNPDKVKQDTKKSKKSKKLKKEVEVYHPINNCCKEIQDNESFPLQANVKAFYDVDEEEAKRRLEKPIWNGEVYTRVCKSGEYPSCRTCKQKIKIGILCLRVDIAELRLVSKNKCNMSVHAHRYCPKLDCLNNRRVKFQDQYQNFQYPEIIYTSHINEVNKLSLKKEFMNSNIIIGE